MGAGSALACNIINDGSLKIQQKTSIICHFVAITFFVILFKFKIQPESGLLFLNKRTSLWKDKMQTIIIMLTLKVVGQRQMVVILKIVGQRQLVVIVTTT